MNPEVTAAIIAASVSVLTLIGTLAAQYFGRRASSRETREALREQRSQLDRTLAEQHTRTLNERFATAADQLGSEKPAIRLAGVYAMAGLADDWEETRQTCVDVLCAYLRMPYTPDPGQDASDSRQLDFQALREVRHTVIRVIAAHLRTGDDAPESWQSLNFDFTGVAFDGGDFTEAHFSGGTVSFNGAKFSDGVVDFSHAQFSGATVSFSNAEFSDGVVDFGYAQFSGGKVYFNGIEFSSGMAYFGSAQFSGGKVYFNGTDFSGGKAYFSQAQFSGGEVDFRLAKFSGSEVGFYGTQFSGGAAYFGGAEFSGGVVSFRRAEFSGAMLDFTGAQFYEGVGMRPARFSGCEVDFQSVADWSFPPVFPWTHMPPSGVRLPTNEDQSKTPTVDR